MLVSKNNVEFGFWNDSSTCGSNSPQTILPRTGMERIIRSAFELKQTAQEETTWERKYISCHEFIGAVNISPPPGYHSRRPVRLSYGISAEYQRALQRRLRRALLEANATNRRHPARPTCTAWAEKVGRRLTTIILSNLNRFKKFTGKFLGKFVVKWIPKLPPHLACVATLPCETLMSAKEANGDGVVNNHLTTNLPRNFLLTF